MLEDKRFKRVHSFFYTCCVGTSVEGSNTSQVFKKARAFAGKHISVLVLHGSLLNWFYKVSSPTTKVHRVVTGSGKIENKRIIFCLF